MTRSPRNSLDVPITILPYPARLEWAIVRRNLRTVRDLVAIHPSDLEGERNCGPRTIDDTRRVLEEYLGTTWELAHAKIRVVSRDAKPHALPDSIARQSPREVLPRHLAWRCLQEGLVTMGDVIASRHLLQMHRRMSKRMLAALDAEIAKLVR